jgi:hypothetical protein
MLSPMSKPSNGNTEKKAEYRAALRVGREWDRQHGLASLGARAHRVTRAARAATEALSKVAPTSFAGACTLVEYVQADLEEFNNFDDWHSCALANAALALKAATANA